jgi:hypothetical protein
MGRPAKSAHEHWVNGTRKHASTVDPEDDARSFVGGRLKMPANYPSEKQAVWKLLFNPIQKRKTLTRADSAAATIIVEMWLRWKTVAALAGTNPIETVSWRDSAGHEHFKQVESAASKMATQLEHKLLAALASFSATPVSRDKTKKTKEPALKPGKVQTVSERLEQEIAALEAQEQAPDDEQQSDEELLDKIDEYAADEKKSEAQVLLDEADRMLASEDAL